MEGSKPDHQRHSKLSQKKLSDWTNEEILTELFERGVIISMSSRKLTKRRVHTPKKRGREETCC